MSFFAIEELWHVALLIVWIEVLALLGHLSVVLVATHFLQGSNL